MQYKLKDLANISNFKIIDEHRRWLRQFDNQHKIRFERRLKNQTESALTEAWARHLLDYQVDGLGIYEDSTDGGPDFICRKNSELFCVEATCLTIKQLCRATGLDHHHSQGYQAYGQITQCIKRAAINKAKQCAKAKDKPTILLIGTLHEQASTICIQYDTSEFILTSAPSVYAEFDPYSEKSEIATPREIVDFHNSAFLKPIDMGGIYSIKEVRRSISAIIICGLGNIRYPIIKNKIYSLPINGVLNPSPQREFKPQLLPNIPFCTLIRENNKIRYQWLLHDQYQFQDEINTN